MSNPLVEYRYFSWFRRNVKVILGIVVPPPQSLPSKVVSLKNKVQTQIDPLNNYIYTIVCMFFWICSQHFYIGLRLRLYSKAFSTWEWQQVVFVWWKCFHFWLWVHMLQIMKKIGFFLIVIVILFFGRSQRCFRRSKFLFVRKFMFFFVCMWMIEKKFGISCVVFFFLAWKLWWWGCVWNLCTVRVHCFFNVCEIAKKKD
jgi:hypothetical protein